MTLLIDDFMRVPLPDSYQIEKLFLDNKLKPSVRAQELTTSQFIEMYRSVYET
ncbi:MAG: hypothetical protein GXY98_07145 [Erysipelothrix sp.]|nr:hypothetical protein [Erysipelothrix sp.]